MNQEFTIGAVKLIEDENGFHVAVEIKSGYDVIASFKYPMDALKYYTEYVTILAELATSVSIQTDNIPEDKEEHNG
jgi:hypothetical protein